MTHDPWGRLQRIGNGESKPRQAQGKPRTPTFLSKPRTPMWAIENGPTFHYEPPGQPFNTYNFTV